MCKQPSYFSLIFPMPIIDYTSFVLNFEAPSGIQYKTIHREMNRKNDRECALCVCKEQNRIQLVSTYDSSISNSAPEKSLKGCHFLLINSVGFYCCNGVKIANFCFGLKLKLPPKIVLATTWQYFPIFKVILMPMCTMYI